MPKIWARRPGALARSQGSLRISWGWRRTRSPGRQKRPQSDRGWSELVNVILIDVFLIYFLNVYVHNNIYIYIYIYHMYIYIYTYICTYIYIYTYMYCIYIQWGFAICVCIRMYGCMYTVTTTTKKTKHKYNYVYIDILLVETND